MKLLWSAVLMTGLSMNLLITAQASGAPLGKSNVPVNPKQYLHLEMEEGTIHCALSGSRDGVKHLESLVRSKRYDGSMLCRAVRGYFIQLGCSDLSETDRIPNIENKVRIPATGHHTHPGTLAFAHYSNGEVGTQLLITTIKSPWLDGVQPVLGQCKPLALVTQLSEKPTIAQAVPRRPTLIIRATIDGADSKSGRNGLAK